MYCLTGINEYHYEPQANNQLERDARCRLQPDQGSAPKQLTSMAKSIGHIRDLQQVHNRDSIVCIFHRAESTLDCQFDPSIEPNHAFAGSSICCSSCSRIVGHISMWLDLLPIAD